MIGEIEAKEQAMRLSGLDGFPSTIPAMKELVIAIQTADTVGIAKAVIDDFLGMSGASRCPTPPDIRRVINSHNPIDEPPWMSGPRPEVCRHCEGIGLVGERCKQTYCDCSDGRSLRHDVTTWKVKPYEPTRYTPETYLAMINAAPLPKSGEGFRQVHPSWLAHESRVRMASPRIEREVNPTKLDQRLLDVMGQGERKAGRG